MKDLTKKYQRRLDGERAKYYSEVLAEGLRQQRNRINKAATKDTTTVIAWVTAILLTVYLFIFQLPAFLIIAGIVLVVWAYDRLVGDTYE